MKMLRNRICLFVLVLLGCASFAQAQALDARGQKLLDEAKGALDQAEQLITNLDTQVKQLKVGDPGTTVQKTQALLADRDKAVQLIGTANTRFRQLPTSQPDVVAQINRVKPLRDTLTAADKTLVQVHNQLANSANAANNAGANTNAPANAAAASQLAYQQQQLLKDASSYLDEVENYLKQIEAKIEPLKVGDPSVPIQDVRSWITYKQTCEQRLGYANNRFKQLPADNAAVKQQMDRVQPLTARVAAVDTKLKALDEGLARVINQGTGDQFQADLDRLKEITLMFNNQNIIQSQPDLAIEIIKQIAPMKTERQRIQQKYADLLQQATNHSEQLRSALANFDSIFGKFDQTISQFAAAAPAGVDQDIAEMLRLAQEGVDTQRTGYFGPEGGVAQRANWAQTKAAVLEAIKPGSPESKAAQETIAAAKLKAKQLASALNETIIAANRPPAEPYNGADKTQLIELIKQKWATSGASGDVLKSGINSQNWRRDTYWRWDGTDTWNKNDVSRIQGFVIVKTDDKFATIHYINLFKDHLAQDRIDAFFFLDPKEEAPVQNRLLLENVK